MADDDISRLLQNAEFCEILPEERNADGINVDKQQVKDFIDQHVKDFIDQHKKQINCKRYKT